MSTNSIKMQIWGVVGFLTSTSTDYCLSSWFIHQKLNIYSTFFVLCRLSHVSWFQGLQYNPPYFWPQVPNNDLRETLKKWFLRSLLFYTTFSWWWKIDDKTKNIYEGHTQTLVCPTYSIIIWNIQPEQWWANIIKLTRTNIRIYLDATLCTE